MKKFLYLALAALPLWLASCVNEWPHPEDLPYDVTLTVHCDTEWLPDFTVDYTGDNTRAENLELIYKFQIFEGGQTTSPVKEFSIFSHDFSRADFDIDLVLMPGKYDVYVWSDYYNPATGKSVYYDISNFAALTFQTPYEANSNEKDAFRGKLSFEIKESMYLHPAANETIVLSRPLARYIFIATDLQEFIDSEISRGHMSGISSRDYASLSTRELEEALEGYSIKVVYPLFLPWVFNVYGDEPYDSMTGISYEGSIEPLSQTQASLGLDYIMVKNDLSSFQVALEIYNAEGVKIGGTSVLNIPVERNHTTLIYGRFLTSQEDAGVSINPDFEGQFNIEYH